MAGIDISVASAAFHVGLRLNQIRWHAEIACLWLDPGAIDRTQSLLADLRAEVLPLLAQENRQNIDQVIRRAREDFASLLGSERYAEQAYNEALDSLADSNDPRPPEDIRADAYAALLRYIDFLTPGLEQTLIAATPGVAGPWLGLGQHLDQSLRPPIRGEMARRAPRRQLVGDIPEAGSLPAPPGWRKMTWQLWREALATVTIPTFGDSLIETRWMTDTPADLVAAIDAEFVRFAPQAAAARPQLTDIERALLQAMHNLGAFDADHRQSFAVIVRAALGRDTDYTNYKDYATRLKQKGMIDSRQGRGGGHWLTASGQAVTEHLKKR